MGFLSGKKGLIVGIANKRSIAWGIAEACLREGADLAFTYLTPLESRVRSLAEANGVKRVFELDLMEDSHLEKLPSNLASFGHIDFVLHAVAFADKTELEGHFVNTSREGFRMALEVSAWSLVGLSKALLPILNREASILALSYYGSEKVIPNYNVMGVAKAALESSVRYLAHDLGPEHGIRVNALSCGPVKTLSSAGIKQFSMMLNWNAANSPLRRNITLQEVGNSGAYLLSDMSKGVTGTTHYVDLGYSAMGSASLEAIDRLRHKTN
ncbi:SDR family oxidoreductase [bacterium]|nr:SDR family oxidoreductase [bacterium]